MSHYLYFLFPMCHMTVSSPALGSYLTICENVARAAALCDLEAPGWGEPWFPHCAFVDSWLTDFCMALLWSFCFCCLFYLCHTNPLVIQSYHLSCALQGLCTDQLTTSRAVLFFVVLFVVCSCALCFVFVFAVCFPVFAR